MPGVEPRHLFFPKILKSDEASHFFGRESAFGQALDHLGNDEAAVAIYGERGIGKSSFAWQLASILDDSNSVFKRSKLQRVGREKRYECIFPSPANKPKSISSVIANILSEKTSEYSLHARYGQRFQDWGLYDSIQKRYGVSLHDIGFKNVGDDLLFTIFKEILHEIKNANPRSSLVVFIDEADEIDNTDGLGQLMKRIDVANFVVVGIGDTVGDIIQDHASAGRKLIGGLVELEGLNSNQIGEIFDHASERSNRRITFTSEYLARAKTVCAGFPWFAQNLGYQSVLSVVRNHDPGEDFTARLGRAEFRLALDAVRGVYQQSLEKRIDFTELEVAGPREIIRVLAKARKPLTDTEISKELIRSERRIPMAKIDNFLYRLVHDASLLTKVAGKSGDSEDRFRFRDPIARTFALEIVDQHSGEESSDKSFS
ncbi:MAG: ATP-binding protein [Hyphomonas sp.]|uniref:ATP-binding protein n=1 Tax=Hyphomonas sp. TaxID=87 RepID=UPI003528F89C